MSDDLLSDLREAFEIKKRVFFEFKELYGLTFAFKTKIIFIKDKPSAAEIKPMGIIYKENGEYYFAPLDEVGDIKAIINEFMKKYSA